MRNCTHRKARKIRERDVVFCRKGTSSDSFIQLNYLRLILIERRKDDVAV